MAQRVTRVRDILPLIPKGTKVFVFAGDKKLVLPEESFLQKLLAIFNAGSEQEDVMAFRVEEIAPVFTGSGGIKIKVTEGRRRA